MLDTLSYPSLPSTSGAAGGYGTGFNDALLQSQNMPVARPAHAANILEDSSSTSLGTKFETQGSIIPITFYERFDYYTTEPVERIVLNNYKGAHSVLWDRDNVYQLNPDIEVNIDDTINLNMSNRKLKGDTENYNQLASSKVFKIKLDNIPLMIAFKSDHTKVDYKIDGRTLALDVRREFYPGTDDRRPPPPYSNTDSTAFSRSPISRIKFDDNGYIIPDISYRRFDYYTKENIEFIVLNNYKGTHAELWDRNYMVAIDRQIKDDTHYKIRDTINLNMSNRKLKENENYDQLASRKEFIIRLEGVPLMIAFKFDHTQVNYKIDGRTLILDVKRKTYPETDNRDPVPSYNQALAEALSSVQT